MDSSNQIILFEEKQVRRVWHKESWWFVVEDIIGLLTNSKNPKKYLAALRSRDKELAKGYPQLVDTLPVATEGGTQRMTCSNRKGILRIIMSVPSPNAEPFKLWLAQVGEERMEEIEDPELAVERMRELYIAKGYPTEWIDTRIRSIDIRKQLTDEWKARKVKEGTEYAILTAEIAKATFDLTPSEHKQFKGLEKQNLRDHMTNLELIFTMLGEEATRHIAVEENAQGFEENRDAAVQGGRLAGKARRNVEEDKRFKVTSSQNFLHLKEINSGELLKEQDEIKE